MSQWGKTPYCEVVSADLLRAVPKCVALLQSTIKELEAFLIRGDGAVYLMRHAHQAKAQSWNKRSILAQGATRDISRRHGV
jgi:hypothetical protein